MAGNPLDWVYFTLREESLRHFITFGFADDPRLDIGGQGPVTLSGSAAPTSVRWYQAQALSFRFEIDLVAKHFSMFIDGAAVPEAQEHPFTIANQDGTFAHMGIQFAGLNDAIMAIDNLRVVAHCGTNVATENSSWGMIKAQWD